MWGTDSKGSLLKPADRADEKKIDTPTAITDTDWKTSFGLLHDNSDDKDTSKDVTIQSVTCGPTDTAWILSNGRCFVAGENKNGQAGVGHKDAVTTPTEIILPSAEKTTVTGVKQAALGSNFSAFVDTAGDLYTAGFGGSAFSGMGYLGHGDNESYYHPKLVESLVEDGCIVDSVQVGEAHMTVLTTEGEVLTAGAGSYGRLGNFETRDQLYLEPVEILTQGVTQIAGGKSFTLALKDGVLYGWGRNHKGQLGTGYGMAVDMYAMEPVPSPIEADELLGRQVTHVAAGHSHAACITSSGELFYWGMGLYLEPVRVNELLHTTVVDVVCGQDYVLVKDVQGKLYSFGTGKYGALGQGVGVKQLNQADVVEALQDQKITSMSAGWKHAACLAQPDSSV
jgi:alpha-tubulin suppressor-like RCC1 family protein